MASRELAFPGDKVRIFLAMIKFEHTIFALPFAYMGALLVQKQIPAVLSLFWITAAMVGARTAAMSLNRLIDRHIDALNPRTVNRALPKGILAVNEVRFYAFLSLVLLLLSAWQLSPLALKLSPLAVAILVFYPYTKRFTWTSHLFLGLALGCAPLGAWIALTDNIALTPVLLCLGVVFWVAGFDIIYACEDYNFDLSAGLHSIPVRFGLKTALTISTLFHLVALIFFILVAFTGKMGLFYLIGLAIAAFLVLKQHLLVSPADLSRAEVAFFNLNGLLSMVLFIFTLLDVHF
ncbi:prenyltransferase [Peptococcaceae bacterium SCADC1_2_3]|jgi:4-hydroxybenzoate polyprenyltransferase|nr:prenyltransferase [Peptococcaceae bacterium SCADC1_2_3]KFI35550.1 prenyltransferase [Peptococcaceae bacterium SCADC1_2_3]